MIYIHIFYNQHGRKRVKPSAEVEKLRKEKEVTKIKEYRNLVESYFQKVSHFLTFFYILIHFINLINLLMYLLS